MFQFCRVAAHNILIVSLLEGAASAGTMTYAFNDESNSAFAYFNNDSGYGVIGSVDGRFTITSGRDGSPVLQFLDSALSSAYFAYFGFHGATPANLPPTDPRSLFAESFANQPLAAVIPGADMSLTATEYTSNEIVFGPELIPTGYYEIEFSLLDSEEGLRLIGASRVQADDGANFSINAAVILVPEPTAAMLMLLIIGAILGRSRA